MKKVIIYFVVLSCSTNSLVSQATKAVLDKIPQESVYLHTNTNLIFAGEYLYYQFYCLLPETKKLSNISTIGYVDLIDQNKTTVFQHKLRLTDGTASSEFFLPADIPSGNYKLIGYTNWMRSFGPTTFYKKDLTIINPYMGDQKVFLKDSTQSNPTNKKRGLSQISTAPFDIRIGKSLFENREEVELSIVSKSGSKLNGTYSLSVRKKAEIKTIDNEGMEYAITPVQQRTNPVSYDHLPETKGPFISGIVEMEPNASKSGQKLMISLPGDNSVFKIATTDTTGAFKTQLEHTATRETMLLRTLDATEETQKVQLDTNRIVDYGEIDFYNFRLSEEMKDYILERSIHNQIENAYFGNRPDSILQPEPIKPFYDGQVATYDLDDYTRFSTLKETIIEILDHVWIDENSEGKLEFKVRYFYPLQDSGDRPLVFLDGAYIHDHEKLLSLPSKSIKTIKVGRDQYLYGSHVFQGIIDISTFEGNSFEAYLDTNTQVISFDQPRIKKNYYKEDYAEAMRDTKKRLPDFRSQLLWLPEIRPNASSFSINFYTSDVSGEFEIILEGVSNLGVPISITESFTVK
ncbi:hypothetical protein [Maribacter aestuarii]|uniref:hypothetical protein n=1 Tax=Maribacter aestuarii TaxID=1130723 RepID=UPI0025A4F0A0|nr:hypothetical protein [Maribacter aestuarii]